MILLARIKKQKNKEQTTAMTQTKGHHIISEPQLSWLELSAIPHRDSYYVKRQTINIIFISAKYAVSYTGKLQGHIILSDPTSSSFLSLRNECPLSPLACFWAQT